MLKHFLILFICMAAARLTLALSWPVQNLPELKAALKKAQPGDTIVLANGEWKNTPLVLETSGAAGKPLVVKAATPGGVRLTGNSFLRFGGAHIEVSGLHFTNGYAEKGAVVEFRVNDEKLANHCRLTQTTIDDFSKPDRSDNDSWIIFWGKNNRMDHCSIGDKFNGGATLIVNLNDERSQDNRHSIDSNHFTGRSPLGSNGGETIRVGVSRYCLTESRTRIKDNLFTRCSGEVEIVSIKSSKNEITGNVFFECEGGLVLRHGNENTVAGNTFIGNGKPFTGGVRVINAGHLIYDNLFLDLAGERFHAAFSVLNGVPNSPLNRYAPVTDVKIHHNTFSGCREIMFGAGKDPERTQAPERVAFTDNFIQTTHELVYEDANRDGGILFRNNSFLGNQVRDTLSGFQQQKPVFATVVYAKKKLILPAGKNGASMQRRSWMDEKHTGASWHVPTVKDVRKPVVHFVRAVESCELPAIVAKATDGDIVELEAGKYAIEAPLLVNKALTLRVKTPGAKAVLVNVNAKALPAFILLENGAELAVSGIIFNASEANFGAVSAGISTGDRPMNRPYKLKLDGCGFTGFNEWGNAAVRGGKSTYADSVAIQNCLFYNNAGGGIDFSAEKEDKGIYNIAYLAVRNCVFQNMQSTVINVYRGGNDESTTGPEVQIDHCTFLNVDNRMQGCVVKLHGVQQVQVTNSIFTQSGSGGRTIWFEEMAWDKLKVDHCGFFRSGKLSAFFGRLNTTKAYYVKPLFRNASAADFRLKNAAELSSAGGEPIGAALYWNEKPVF